MKTLFYSILSFGVNDTHNALDSRRIKTINLLNLLVVFFLFFGLITYFIINTSPLLSPVLANLGFLGLSILSIYLSKIGKTTLSFLLFTLNVNASIFYINQFYPPDSGAYLYYYALIISVVLLNNPTSIDRFSVFHFIICAVFFLFDLFVDVPGLLDQDLNPSKIKVLWYYNMIVSATVTALLSGLLTRLIYNQNREIVAQNKDLINSQQVVDASLKEKEVLLAELHHRVKNNLAIITGLLKLQEDATESMEAKQVLADSKSRILSMALVHKMLYENPELKKIDIGKYSEGLINEIFNSYNLTNVVRIFFTSQSIVLPVSKSIPLGLILNEIVTNSIKYAFRSSEKKPCEFTIRIMNENGEVVIEAKDNGPGFPESFDPKTETHSLGVFLIRSLAEQIDGTVTFSNDCGARIVLRFIPD